jgi:hypothetical protein
MSLIIKKIGETEYMQLNAGNRFAFLIRLILYLVQACIAFLAIDFSRRVYQPKAVK